MSESIPHLVKQLSESDISRARAKAPADYEDDYVRATAITKFISEGGDFKKLTAPEKWRDTFIALSYHTELPPKECAKLAGVTLAYIRYYLAFAEDTDVLNALNIGRAANFEARVDMPTQRDLRSPGIPLAGLNALAGWTTQHQKQRNAAEREIDKVIEARKALNLDIIKADAVEQLEVETMRVAKSSDVSGVLGLGDQDIEINEDE